MSNNAENKIILNPKKIGRAIVDMALEKHKDAQSNKVVNQVGTIMERMQVLDQLKTKTDRQYKLCKDQLAAIESGEFEIEQFSATIKFKNKELNIDWNETGRW